MKLVVTADLHYNHLKSRPLAEEIIDEINRAGGDVLLVVGDTAITDSDWLERCLEQFQWKGPKLFVAGNHELWTRGGDSYAIYREELPRRVRALGWRWLEEEPFVAGSVGIVGSIGWYDYSFAQASLGIPRRFYEQKISPGAAEYLGVHRELFEPSDDISDIGRETIARWNDGKFIRLGRSDEEFLGELIGRLERQLAEMRGLRTVVAAVHHVPFRELLPPPHSHQWDFAKAYLGSERIGQTLLKFANVREVFCGHSHLAAEARVGAIHAVNIGAGYRAKAYRQVEIED